MYLPNHKILQRLFRFGLSMIKFKNGVISTQRYEGPFIETSDGRFYTSLGSDAEELYIQDSENEITSNQNSTLFLEYQKTPLPLLSHRPKPTDKDIKRGYMERYFARDKRTGQTTELHLQSYQAVGVIEVYEREQIKWIITGTLEDSILKGHRIQGVKSLNENTILKLEQSFPLIRTILSDPGEFYTEIITPEETQQEVTPPKDIIKDPEVSQVIKVKKPPLQPTKYYVMDEKGEIKQVEKFE